MSKAGNHQHLPIWGLVAAAGCGSRFGKGVPKQHLEFHQGQSLLEFSLGRLLASKLCQGVVVAVDAEHGHWRPPSPPSPNLELPLRTVIGGQKRAESVLIALRSIAAEVGDCWVLVQDAARPCLRSEDLRRLVEAVQGDEVGGFLAVPMTDSCKRGDGRGRSPATLERTDLWRAQTPQMFRASLLIRALEQAAAQGIDCEDEVQAVQLLGLSPLIVAGSSGNIKITDRRDWQRAHEIINRP